MTAGVTRHAFRGALAGGVLQVSNALVSLIQFRLLLEYLGKELAGAWFLFLSLRFVLIFFDFGISPTVSREISFRRGYRGLDDGQRSQEVKNLLATSLRIFHVLSLGAVFIGGTIGFFFLKKATPVQHFDEVAIAWLIYVIAATNSLYSELGLNSIVGFEKVATEKLIRLSTQLAGLGLSLFVLHSGYGIIGLAVSFLVEGLLLRTVAWLFLRKLFPAYGALRGHFSLAQAKQLVRVSFKWTLSSLGANLLFKLDTIVIAMTLGTALVPNYEAATKIGLAIIAFAFLFTHSLTPFISKAYASGDLDMIRHTLTRNVRYSMALLLIAVCFFAVFGENVINVWLKPGHFVGTPVLWTMAALMALLSHHAMHISVATATGHIIFVAPSLIAGALNFGLSYLLSLKLGVLGVTLGTLLAQLLTNNWYVPYRTLNLLGISKRTYVKSVMLPLIAFVVSLLGVNFFLAGAVQASDLVKLIIVFPLSTLSGLALAFLLILNSEERQLFRQRVLVWQQTS